MRFPSLSGAGSIRYIIGGKVSFNSFKASKGFNLRSLLLPGL